MQFSVSLAPGEYTGGLGAMPTALRGYVDIRVARPEPSKGVVVTERFLTVAAPIRFFRAARVNERAEKFFA